MDVCARSASGGLDDFDLVSDGFSGELFRKKEVTLCGILGIFEGG